MYSFSHASSQWDETYRTHNPKWSLSNTHTRTHKHPTTSSIALRGLIAKAFSPGKLKCTWIYIRKMSEARWNCVINLLLTFPLEWGPDFLWLRETWSQINLALKPSLIFFPLIVAMKWNATVLAQKRRFRLLPLLLPAAMPSNPLMMARDSASIRGCSLGSCTGQNRICPNCCLFFVQVQTPSCPIQWRHQLFDRQPATDGVGWNLMQTGQWQILFERYSTWQLPKAKGGIQRSSSDPLQHT